VKTIQPTMHDPPHSWRSTIRRERKAAVQVELVSADHQNKPDIATGIAPQWYATGNVDMITD
jgi:hypothetical protein